MSSNDATTTVVRQSEPAGYLAIPAAGKGPGVLVLHPWWGLNETIREVCDRLATLGFAAYAPDLYHGELATTIEEAERLSQQLDGNVAQAEISAAVDRLWAYVEDQTKGISIIGFSLGAYFALQLSGADPTRVRKVVLFYGTGDGDFAQAKATYLGHFADSDPYEPAESVAWLENALKSANRPVTFYSYAGVGHWFFEPDRIDAYNEAAAALAWERTVAFLKGAIT
ncbi:MAG: dienelactone hydrolase family protein [Caldilineaceae bacterium]